VNHSFLLNRLSRKTTTSFLLIVMFLVGASSRAVHAKDPSRRERIRYAAKAEDLYDRQKYEEAMPWLEKALSPGVARRDAKHWWPLLGRCHEVSRNFQKALTAYQKAHQLQRKNVDRKLDLARVYARVDLNDQAIEFYTEILDRDPQRRDWTKVSTLHKIGRGAP